MDELQFKVTQQQKDALTGEITARRPDDTNSGWTFGDEALSRYILEKFKSRY